MSPASPVLTLDHIGYVGRDLASMLTAARRLGLAPTQPRILSARDPASGELRSLQQHSCHVVLAQGYLELTSVATDDPAHHLAAWRSRGDGVHILALGSPDPEATRAQCIASALAATPIARAARAIDYGRLRGDAQFDWFMLEAASAPEALICMVRNLRPELVYQPEVISHPLGVLALDEVVLVTPDPSAFRERHQGWLASTWQPRTGGFTVPLHAGHLNILSPAAAAERYGEEFTRPRWQSGGIAAVALRVASLGAATRLLRDRGVGFRLQGPDLMIAPEDALGAVLLLRE